MKFQVCRYKLDRDSNWEVGVAILEAFNLHNIYNIIDKNGKCLDVDPYDYSLVVTLGLGAIDLDLCEQIVNQGGDLICRR